MRLFVYCQVLPITDSGVNQYTCGHLPDACMGQAESTSFTV